MLPVHVISKKNQYSALTVICKRNKRKAIYNKEKFQCELSSTSIKETQWSSQMPAPRHRFTGKCDSYKCRLSGPVAFAIQMLQVALPSVMGFSAIRSNSWKSFALKYNIPSIYLSLKFLEIQGLLKLQKMDLGSRLG